MYELKNLERYLRVNLLEPDPRLIKKIIYHAAVSQRLRNTGVREARNSEVQVAAASTVVVIVTFMLADVIFVVGIIIIIIIIIITLIFLW